MTLFRLCITVFFVFVLPLLAQAHPLDTVAPHTWYEIPRSAIRPVLFPWPAGINWGSSGHTRMFDESGATYDSKRQRLLIWGGGHGDYAGNEIYAFDLTSLAWTRLTDPCLRTDPTSTTEASGYYPDASGTPDPQCPRSAHAYWYTAHIPTTDQLCLFGQSYMFPRSGTTNHVNCFDFATNRWQRKADAMTYGGLAWALYDPFTQHVWVHGLHDDTRYDFWAEYNPVTDTYTRRSTGLTGTRMRAAPLLDTKRHRLVILGTGMLQAVDLPAAGMLTTRTLAPTGATEILQMVRGGFAYDAANDLYAAWSGDAAHNLAPTDIWVIDPESWVITRQTPAIQTNAPSMPITFGGTSNTNGVYGRWAYIPSLRGFILVNNRLDENVWFLRLATQVSVPTPLPLQGLRLQP